jgi:two-component system cell cycle sensor histidine kinase/response regulator CckA
MNILVVDDKQENVYLLEVMLKASGHEVHTAENGAVALERLQAGGIELIVSDILMPVMDGFQLCRNVKTDKTLSHIPFIVYTATYTGPQDEEFAMKIGADRFIQKPCEPQAFMEALDEVAATAGSKSGASEPESIKEEEALKLYSERLVRKLEQKMLEVERELKKRQQAEEALRISNTRLHLSLESGNIGLWEWNLENNEVWFSPEWKYQLGYQDHEIPNLYEEWEKRLHPEDKPRLLAQVESYLQGREPQYRVEFRLRHKNGSYRWIAASGQLIIEKDNNSKRFMGCHVDITERKRAEEEKELLMAAIEQAGEIVLVTDTKGIIQYVNPVFEKVTGYSHQEAVGQNPRMLKSGKHDVQFYEDLWTTITAGKTWKGRFINKRKDGKLITGDATISPVYDASGHIVNFVAVKRDITEHLQLEQQLFQAQKIETVGQLASGVAHDYNNMLSVILGYTELTLAKVKPDDPVYPNLTQILKAANRSIGITHQLLTFARKEAVLPQVLDLNEAIEGALKMLRRFVGENIELAWQPGGDLGPVKIDPSQADQLLVNLCINARDAIPDVGAITIETSNVTIDDAYCALRPAAAPGDFIRLSISDNGCGMDKDTLEKIFEPFFTTKQPGEGTGLGLATCYGIVKQIGGFINVYSEPGQGTVFQVHLPRHAKDAGHTSEKATFEIPLGRGETVLVVDDELAVLLLAEQILNSIG